MTEGGISGASSRGWLTTARSPALSGRKTKDTTPELTLRRALHARGLRYRLHVRVAVRGSADIVFMRARVAVFVDGCFWHSCPQHGETSFKGPNAKRWMAKMAEIRERDGAVTADAARDYEVIRIWECQIKEDVESVADVVQVAVARRLRQIEGEAR